MNAPPGPLAARIEEFERTADPRLVLSGAALTEAEQAMRACTGEAADAAIWRLIGGLHLARYRLDGSGGEAAVAGVFLAAAAVVDPGGMPETTNVPSADAPQTWAELVDEVLHHVDPDTFPHVGLLLHALIRRALSTPSAQVCDQLVESLLRETMEDPHPSWAPEALAILGGGLLRLFAATGEPEALDDAVHVHLRAALGGPGGARRLRELAAVLGLALPGDPELIGAHLVAARAATRAAARGSRRCSPCSTWPSPGPPRRPPTPTCWPSSGSGRPRWTSGTTTTPTRAWSPATPPDWSSGTSSPATCGRWRRAGRWRRCSAPPCGRSPTGSAATS